eukprot:m.98539 g.98539  ORF g.98539 m.98539 type:complete len:61 (+) comp27076_c0_seq1:267-449(+)
MLIHIFRVYDNMSVGDVHIFRVHDDMSVGDVDEVLLVLERERTFADVSLLIFFITVMLSS